MYLSRTQQPNIYEEGEYFSYSDPSSRRIKNIKTCLPGGYSGSGPEYEMYKSNCLSLMAEQCSDTWGKECDLYLSNINQKEADLFKAMVQQRQTPDDYAERNSCYPKAGIVPNQVDMTGINPFQHGDSSYNKITYPRACPPASKVEAINHATDAEKLMYQRYHQTLPDTEFPYSRSTVSAPVFRREPYQASVIHKEQQQKQQHQVQLESSHKPARAHLQPEMVQNALSVKKENYVAEWNPMRLQAHHYQSQPELDEPPQPQPFVPFVPKNANPPIPAFTMAPNRSVPTAIQTEKTPIPFYPPEPENPDAGQQYPQPPAPFMPSIAKATPMPFLPAMREEKQERTEIKVEVEEKPVFDIPQFVFKQPETSLEIIMPDIVSDLIPAASEEAIGKLLAGSDCEKSACSIAKILNM